MHWSLAQGRKYGAITQDVSFFFCFYQQDGSRQLDLSLYLQYDSHVQQAVDEKVATRCLMHTERPVEDPPTDSIHRSSALFSALEKINRRTNPVVTSSSTSPTVKSTLGPFRSLITIANVTTTNAMKNPSLPLTSYQGWFNSTISW